MVRGQVRSGARSIHNGHLGQPMRDDHLGYYLPSFYSTMQLEFQCVFGRKLAENLSMIAWCFCERSEHLNPHEGWRKCHCSGRNPRPFINSFALCSCFHYRPNASRSMKRSHTSGSPNVRDSPQHKKPKIMTPVVDQDQQSDGWTRVEKRKQKKAKKTEVKQNVSLRYISVGILC